MREMQYWRLSSDPRISGRRIPVGSEIRIEGGVGAEAPAAIRLAFETARACWESTTSSLPPRSPKVQALERTGLLGSFQV